ncbi:MAG TPA: HAD family hydrolase [Candidatus Angelobacter sp.]|nr:HAD family hydrolase [Candidatus Angelobacter sp.]
MTRAAVFLDRDGVLIADTGYPHEISDAVPLDSVPPALSRLQQAGFQLVVVSNQSGVGRGLFSSEDVARFNAALCANLDCAGVKLAVDDFFICPHAPNENCDCRKPKPGLLLRAAMERSLDLSRSFLIGDKESDVQAANAAGVQPILLVRERSILSTAKTLVAADLAQAVDLICKVNSSTLPH